MLFLTLAYRNVRRNRERSLLTLIGVLLAVGSFVALVSLAEGLYKRVSLEMGGRDVDVYVLPATAMALPSGPIGTVGLTSDTIGLAWIDVIAKLKNVHRAEGVIRQTWTGRRTRFPVLAIDPDAVVNFFPSLSLRGGIMMQHGEVMLGIGLAREEYNRTEQIDKLQYSQKEYPVSAIVSGGGFQDYFAYIPLETVLESTNADGVDEIWIQVQDKNNPQQVIDQILQQPIPNVRILTRKQYLGAANDFISYAWLLQVAIAAIGILIAITASMNTMLMSTYERLREFSTMRAIGAPRATVAAMIVAESVMLNLAGGLLGLLFGWVASGVLDRAVVLLLQLPFPLAQITPRLLFQALALSGVVGLVGAVIPCFLVWRLKIVDALRLD
ncbi:MAG: ABC transporter permease [Armatimonadetes bacterium]|nr:ABC transporter permease [Armatimonadota bacterium]